MKFQLIMRDEYEHPSIIASGEDLKKMLEKGMKEVDATNMENALTADEKLRNWESYLVFVVNANEKLIGNVFYGGKDSKGKHVVSVLQNDTYVSLPLEEALAKVNGELRFYIGEYNGQILFAKDDKKNVITSFSHRDVQKKNSYFVHKV